MRKYPWLLLVLFILIMTSCNRNKELDELTIQKISEEKTKRNNSHNITLYHHFSESGGIQWIIDSIELFKQSHPNTHVEIHTISPDNYGQVIRRLYASGNMPDIYISDNLYSDTVYIHSGFAVDLTNLTFIRENIKTSVIKGAVYNNKIWCLPIEMVGYGVIYNRDVFEQAGIEKIPETYSEFMNICRQLSNQGVTPIVAPYKENWSMLADINADMAQSSYLNNTDWRISIEKDLYLWSDNFFGFTNALSRLGERSQFFNDNPFETSWTSAAQMIAEGEAAMVLSSTRTIAAIREHNSDTNIGMFIFPWSDDVEKNNFPLKSTGGFVINGKSEEMDVAIELLEHFSSVKIGNLFQEYNKSISVVKGVNDHFDPAFSELITYMDQGRKVDFSLYKSQFDKLPLNNLFHVSLIKFLQDEEKDVEEHLKRLDEETESILYNNQRNF